MSLALDGMIQRKQVADVVVVGAGVIGVAIALEVQQRGARVVVVERGEAMRQASYAAAGMLGVDDPGNPAELLALARLSVDLYPRFLRRVEQLSGLPVPFQTETTIQYVEGGVTRLAERSIDPRQLAEALLAAMRPSPIELLELSTLQEIQGVGGALRLRMEGGGQILAKSVVYATGAWMGMAGQIPVRPRKGQMLRVQLPKGLALSQVHRSEQVYVVPRTAGPQAGTALIGATVEDVGFDVAVHEDHLTKLRVLASALVPELAVAPLVEAWAGLRPGTPDGLPVIGESSKPGHFVATGHFRNGVLLAPATAVLIADLLVGRTPAIDLNPFSPSRFQR